MPACNATSLKHAVSSAYVVGLVFYGCGTPSPSLACFEQATEPLFGGSADAGSSLGPRTRDFEGSIGRVSIEGAAEDGSALSGACTATRISATWALTARHCLMGLTEAEVYVDFAPDQRESSPDCDDTARDEVGVVRWIAHPEQDLLLIELATPTRRPIPVDAEAVALDAAVSMVGYGLREDSSQGLREFLPGRVTSIAGDHLRVSAGDDRGACIGDSGGPLLRVAGAGDGAPRLVGVLSTGSPTCVGFDDYVRIDRVFEWVTCGPSTKPAGTSLPRPLYSLKEWWAGSCPLARLVDTVRADGLGSAQLTENCRSIMGARAR